MVRLNGKVHLSHVKVCRCPRAVIFLSCLVTQYPGGTLIAVRRKTDARSEGVSSWNTI